MAKYIYPAIFEPEGELYNVSFPDIEGCFTFGESLEDSFLMAQDALSLMLCDYEDNQKEMPKPSNIKSIKQNSNSIVSFVSCDTTEYRKYNYDNRLVNKTVTIEAWLNNLAEKAHLNCSRLLRNAIKEELQIK